MDRTRRIAAPIRTGAPQIHAPLQSAGIPADNPPPRHPLFRFPGIGRMQLGNFRQHWPLDQALFI